MSRARGHDPNSPCTTNANSVSCPRTSGSLRGVEESIASALEGLGRPLAALQALKGERRVFLVGGTVRDIIMGRAPTDYDFAVSGSGIEFARMLARRLRASFVLLSEPDDQARVVYPGTRDSPGQRGQSRVFGARIPGQSPRKAGTVPVTLDFNGFGEQTILDDLKRRDFTINAIACEVEGPVQTQRPQRTRRAGRKQSASSGLRIADSGLLDPFDGRKAIAEQRIVPVSAQSLASDPLRLLRAIRFALELGFQVDSEVWQQARGVSLAGVAAERIGYELLRIMNCDRSLPHLERLSKLGFLHQLFPEAKPLLDYPELMKHSLGTYRKLEELTHRTSFFSQFEPEFQACVGLGPHFPALLKLAGLFHDIGKPETEFLNEKAEVHFYGHDALGAKYIQTIAGERLRLSRDDARVLKVLVDYHMRLHLLATGPELTDRAIRRYFRDLGDLWFGLMMVTFADGYATAGHTRHLETMFERMIALKREYDSKVKVKRLVTGDDLIALGLKPGPAFKTMLAELEELQVEGKIVSKEQGLEYVQTNLERLTAECPRTAER